MNESDTIIKRLTKEGWVEARQSGSHRIFKKQGVAHVITVPHPRKDLGKGLRRKINRDAGW